jgi:hypothetical protein
MAAEMVEEVEFICHRIYKPGQLAAEGLVAIQVPVVTAEALMDSTL